MSAPSPSPAEVSAERLVALAAVAAPARGHSGFTRDGAGGRAGARRGPGLDLYDLRAYQEGDDPRRLDPAATARSGRPHVRTYHEEVERTLHLVADFRSPMLWGTRARLRSVAAAEALAVEGWRCVAAGGRVALRAVADDEETRLAPRPGADAMLAIAGELAGAHAAALAAAAAAPSGETETLDRLLERAGGAARTGAAMVLATGYDAPGAEFARVVEAVSHRCRLSILLVQDAVELAPPAGVFSFRDGVRGRVLGRFTASPSAHALRALGLDVRLVDASADLARSA